jgi:hypothetical protein
VLQNGVPEGKNGSAQIINVSRGRAFFEEQREEITGPPGIAFGGVGESCFFLRLLS